MRIFVCHFFPLFFELVVEDGWLIMPIFPYISKIDFWDVSVMAGWNVIWRFAQILAQCTSTTAWVTIFHAERSVANRTSRVCWEVRIRWQSKEQLAGWVTWRGMLLVLKVVAEKHPLHFWRKTWKSICVFLGEVWNPFPWMTWNLTWTGESASSTIATTTTTFSNLHWFTSPKPNDSPLCYKPPDLSNLFKGA